MKALTMLIARVGERMDTFSIILLVVVLNISWTLTLNSFGQHFQTVAGVPLLDLENVRSVMSAPDAAALVSQYSADAKSLYWSFFILDNLMPPVVFGAFALLWAKLLSRSSNSSLKRLSASPLLLVPFGVGLFDWFENLAFISAIMSAPAVNPEQTLQIGLIFVQLKALCLFATFGLTMVLVIFTAIGWVIRRARGMQVQPA